MKHVAFPFVENGIPRPPPYPPPHAGVGRVGRRDGSTKGYTDRTQLRKSTELERLSDDR
jgi:hypothetical protein